MNPPNDKEKSSLSPTHCMKVRRVWTYNQPRNSYQRLHEQAEIQTATFRDHTYARTEKPNKKNELVHTLISKLKNVERPQEKSSEEGPISKKLETQACTSSDIKRGLGKKCNDYQQKSSYFSQNIIINESYLKDKASRYCADLKKQKNSNLDELKQENMILKEKMNELIIENERLKLRFRKYVQEMDQRVCSRERQVKRKEQILAEKEKAISLRYLELEIAKTAKDIQQIAHSYISKKIHHLTIQKQLEETFLPQQNLQLSKAIIQVKQLKLDKLELQKKCNQKLNLYRKQKEDEIDKMKKGFTNNLKYYKELLLKVSLKSGPEIKRYQEDTFETVILQTSSADQS